MKRKEYSKKIAEKCEKFLSFFRDRRRPNRTSGICDRPEKNRSAAEERKKTPAKKEISSFPHEAEKRRFPWYRRTSVSAHRRFDPRKRRPKKSALPADAAVFRVGCEHPCSVGLPCPEPPQKERTDYTRPREIDPDQFSDLAQKAVFTVFRKTSPLSAANLS